MGCLQFSFRLLHRDASSVIFVQYLIALAAVDAIKSKPGYEVPYVKLQREGWWRVCSSVLACIVNQNHNIGLASKIEMAE